MTARIEVEHDRAEPGQADQRQANDGLNDDGVTHDGPTDDGPTDDGESRPAVAVVGATGAVGEVLLAVLEERAFPARDIRLLASERSAGSTVRLGGTAHTVRPVTPDAFEGVDLVFFAATGSLSRDLAPAAVERGATVIDKSGTWRMDPSVPLVVPEINAEAIDGSRGIIASPNCTTVGVAMALAPIERAAGIAHVVVTTLQAASGAGREGVEALVRERGGAEDFDPALFAAPIHDNVVPLCEGFADDGYSTEEHKLRGELRKLLGRPELPVSVTCVRVPVAVGHSAALLVRTRRPLSAEDARACLGAWPGVEVVDDPARRLVPTAHDVRGRDAVLVGRVRREQDGDGLWLWQVADNLRKGAATNAVQIAETWMARRAARSAGARA